MITLNPSNELDTRSHQTELSWIMPLRQAALSSYKEQGIPTRQNEEYRFTDVRKLSEIAFTPAPEAELSIEQYDALPFVNLAPIQLVFVNGRFSAGLSNAEDMPEGITFQPLAEALKGSELPLGDHFGRLAQFEQMPFTALNTVYMSDGAVLQFAKNTDIETAIQLVFVSVATTEPIVSHPRLLVIAAQGSSGSIIETYVTQNESVHFTNSVAEFRVSANAHLDHTLIQQECDQAIHIGSHFIDVARSGRLVSHNISLGADICRNDVYARLSGEGGEVTLNGIYLSKGTRLVDNHTTIDHAVPNCNSHEVYKGVIDDNAKGVFNGKIFVREDAQKTDAKQTNKTLLLSETAQINTKPQLEIFADDVKCTHGATIGQLNPDQLFYLRARGISKDDARSMLTLAFLSDVADGIKNEAIRDAVNTRLEEMLLGLSDN